MADRATNDLTRGPVAASLFRLTAPMMVAVSTSIVVQMIEVGFIGAVTTVTPSIVVPSGVAGLRFLRRAPA